MIDPPAPTRLGFLTGKGRVPENSDAMAADEISAAFAGETPVPDAEAEHRDHDLEATGADARGLQRLTQSDDEAT